MFKPECPCKADCSDRDSICHTICERYLKYKKLKMVYRKECKLQKEMIDAEKDGINRMQRLRGSNGIRIGSRRK